MKHTKGPWRRQGAMLLGDDDTIVVDNYYPNPQDADLIEAAPKLADLLQELHAEASHYRYTDIGEKREYLCALLAEITILLQILKGSDEPTKVR